MQGNMQVRVAMELCQTRCKFSSVGPLPSHVVFEKASNNDHECNEKSWNHCRWMHSLHDVFVILLSLLGCVFLFFRLHLMII